MTIDIDSRWTELWETEIQTELEDERSGDYTPDQFYISGRKSKEFPNKENPDWWTAKGPGMVRSWVTWRDNSGLSFWTAPDGQPGIELQVWAENDNGDAVLSVIDRVMEDERGNLYIIDIKSGSQTPAWPRQLALNNLGLGYQYGIQAQYGGFWDARKGCLVGDGMEPFDLRIYSDEWLWDQVHKARMIRDQQLFVAQPTNLCKTACGVREFCVAVGGALSYTQSASHITRMKDR